MNRLESIRDAVITGRLKHIQGLIREALAEHATPTDILKQGLLPGMDVVGKRFKAHEIYIPEVLLSAAVMKSAMTVLKPLFVSDEVGGRGTIVIGTVRGDLHDIGKNLVIIMLEGAGYKVVDLGTNVPGERFVQVIREEKPLVLGMSAMITTTMTVMKDVIDLLKKEGLRGQVTVIVGGAPLNAAFAEQIGADAYAEDAIVGVDIINRLTS